MSKFSAPVIEDYQQLVNSPFYDRAQSAEGTRWLVLPSTEGLDPESAVQPITRISGVTLNNTMDKYPIEELGLVTVNEHADGKFRVSGTIGSFYVPRELDSFMSSQDYLGLRYILINRIAEGFPGAGIPLLMITGVAFSGNDVVSQGGQPMRRDIRFVGSKLYKPEELASLGL